MSWFDSLPPAETPVPCGTGTHTVRWEAGRLILTAHPDAEAELVLGALGGDKPGCVTVAETWARHARDLTVLTSGPRCDADRISVDWSQIEELRAQLPPRLAQLISGTRPSPAAAGTPEPTVRVARRIHYGHAGHAGAAGQFTAGLPGSRKEDAIRRLLQQIELLELLALGPQFQFLLAGTVIAAWAGPDREGDRAARRPELSGVLTGRFAPAAQEWLGIDPDTVTVAPHEGAGWGGLELTGTGRRGRLRSSLPLRWLAEVWACGLAVVGGHLVVAVEEPGYPVAGVLALSAPDAEPVRLRARATGRSAGGLVTWTL
jgi:hypothetical protein